MNIYVTIAIIAYLLGSIPFGYILLRVFRGTDVRATGSGNIGATNVARSAPGLGIATLLLDGLKGFVAVLLAERMVVRPVIGIDVTLDTEPIMIAVGVAALFAMLGHIFPVWLKFKGGKGVATGAGVFLAIAWKPLVIVLLVFAVVYALTKYVSLASILATAAFPVVVYVMMGRQSLPLMPFIVAAVILIIGKHHENIRRLISGTERRFSVKKTGGAA